jgi:excisionase family DNA binding protein
MEQSKISIVLLTNDEVCSILNISKRSLQNYRDRRMITFIQCGRKILYTEDSIKAFLEAHHIKATCMEAGPR